MSLLLPVYWNKSLPYGAYILLEGLQGYGESNNTVDPSDPGYDASPSVSSAISRAQTNMGDYTGSWHEVVLGHGNVVGIASSVGDLAERTYPVQLRHDYVARVAKLRYKFVFQSATCYFKVWWDELEYISAPYKTLTNTISKEWSAHSFIKKTVDPSDITTWEDGFPPVEIQPPITPPSLSYGSSEKDVFIKAFSFLDGYIPPMDGSANGFPAS